MPGLRLRCGRGAGLLRLLLRVCASSVGGMRVCC